MGHGGDSRGRAMRGQQVSRQKVPDDPCMPFTHTPARGHAPSYHVHF